MKLLEGKEDHSALQDILNIIRNLEAEALGRPSKSYGNEPDARQVDTTSCPMTRSDQAHLAAEILRSCSDSSETQRNALVDALARLSDCDPTEQGPAMNGDSNVPKVRQASGGLERQNLPSVPPDLNLGQDATQVHMMPAHLPRLPPIGRLLGKLPRNTWAHSALLDLAQSNRQQPTESQEHHDQEDPLKPSNERIAPLSVIASIRPSSAFLSKETEEVETLN